jgi:hypothetical protein
LNERNIKFFKTEELLIYLLPLAAFLGLAVPLIFGYHNLVLLGSYLALPMFVAPLIYLKIKNIQFSIQQYDNKYLRYLLICCYLFFLSVSLFLLAIHDTRTVLYYLAVTLMAVSVLLQILLFHTSKKDALITLLQIMILVLGIIWGVNLKYHYFIGRTDLFGHTWLIDNLLNDGFIGNEFEIYKAFPLWHVLCATFIKISGIWLPIHKTAFFLNGIIYSLMTAGIYLVLNKILHNNKIALLGALLASLNPDVIFYGMYSIPRSVVSFLEVILILLLVVRATPGKIILSVILTLAMVVYHPASMPFILLLLLLLLLIHKTYSLENRGYLLSLNYFIFAICITLSYWAFYAERLFRTLIASFVTPAPKGILTKSIVQTPIPEFFNYLQFTPLLIFMIIGSLWILRSEKVPGLGKIISLLGLLSPIFTFPGPSLLLNRLAAMNLARFGEYSFIFICVPAAAGLYCLFYSCTNRKIKTATIILFAMMAFLSISNDFTASDKPLMKRPFYTYYLTEQECTAFDHLASCASGFIMSDYVTIRYLLASQYQTKAHILEANLQNMVFLRQSEQDIILIRNEELKKRPLLLYSCTGPFQFQPTWRTLDYYYQDMTLWSDLKKLNKIYESDEVTGFI